MILEEPAVFITDVLSNYLDARWLMDYAALQQLFEVMPIVKEQDNPATLDLLTGAMLRIITDMHNITHGRLGTNG